MKKIIPIILIASILFYVSSCEKDDICVEGDTPLLVIGFYNIDDTTAFKSVQSIRIRNIDIDSIISDDSYEGAFRDRSTIADSVQVPLRGDATTTSYQIISNSASNNDSEETGNIDTLTISYDLGEAFISRACGFVANYNNISVSVPESTENWIQDIKVVQSNVINTDSIHVKIYH